MINDKILKILDDYYAPIKLPDNNRAEIKLSIRALIEEVFEECKLEKRPDTDAQDLRSGSFVRGQDGFRAGYNTAIQDFEANFKKVMGK